MTAEKERGPDCGQAGFLSRMEPSRDVVDGGKGPRQPGPVPAAHSHPSAQLRCRRRQVLPRDRPPCGFGDEAKAEGLSPPSHENDLCALHREYVLHCHILDHEDFGMMLNVEVVPREELSAVTQAVTHGQH
jgi:Multicopper oxidase